MTAPLFVGHLAVSLVLVGLIWTIQIVHYPLFSQVGADGFAEYEALHSARISVLVVPLMTAELVTAGLLLLARPAAMPAWAAGVGLALVLLVWACTALLSVPAHSVLAGGFDAAAHHELVLTNWIRTVAWTLRGGLLLWVLGRMLGAGPS